MLLLECGRNVAGLFARTLTSAVMLVSCVTFPAVSIPTNMQLVESINMAAQKQSFKQDALQCSNVVVDVNTNFLYVD
jgi:hypothetical protein